VLVSVSSSSGSKIIKIEQGSTQWSELLLDSNFVLKTAFFFDPSGNDLSFMFGGSMTTATDGTVTKTWTETEGFLMHTDTAETCLTYTYAWGTPTGYLAASYSSATTSSCLTGWQTDLSPSFS
jgi:hypothetical protein